MKTVLKNTAILVLALVAAVLARKFLLGALDTRIVWVTFYPAVMLVALFASWFPGLLMVGASCLVALYGWPWLASGPFIKDSGDQLGLVAFLFNCLLIVAVAEIARRARVRAIKAKEEAEEANRAKSLFLANMSHELRTPLNAVLGFSELLMNERDLSTDHRRVLGIIHRSGDHLLSLINSVLDLAKIEAGKTVLIEEAFDPKRLLETIGELMDQPARAKGTPLQIDASAGLPPFVTADQGKLRQILVNLVGNALKFTHQGGVTVRARWIGSSGPVGQGTLVVEVEDTGLGIAPEDQQRIFESFVQVGPPETQTGTGLGLTLSRQFADLMGGTLTVESTPGRGSTFRLTLPVRLATAEALMAASDDSFRGRVLAPGQKVARILVAEDQAENRELLVRILEKAGFEVRTAVNGEEAVRGFVAWKPDFIWMDWRMPKVDGLEAARRIRALEGGDEVKIVVLSASVLRSDREQVLAAGVDDFEPKPLRTERIFASLARHLELRFDPDPRQAAPSEASYPAIPLAPALVRVSAPVRGRLRTALTSLSPGRIREAVDEVAREDPVLAEELRTRVDRLQYTALLQALPPEDQP